MNQSGNLEWQERAIESKRTLLAYLRSKPKNFTIENYLCVTDILRKSGWQYADSLWKKADVRLATLEAAELELNRQIAADKDWLLRQTVKTYRGNAD